MVLSNRISRTLNKKDIAGKNINMQDCWVRTRATLPARDVELQHGSSVERHLLKHIDT